MTQNLEQQGLCAENLVVGYGDVPVLSGLSLTLPVGAFTAIVGPNGCGKSTLVRTLARTLRPREGRVLLDGRPLSAWRPKQLARELAFLPQDPVLPDGVTVRSLVGRGRHPYHSPLRQWVPGDDEAIERAMRLTGVAEYEDAALAELSGGQRQRAWIAMILAQETPHVLLDEPTSFLDIAHQIDILYLCRDMTAAGRSVVAVLHDLNQAARYADHLVVMRHGAVCAQGSPEDILGGGDAGADLVREVFDLSCEVARDPQSGTPMIVPLARAASDYGTVEG
ncbi:ABC transporter ATP-binding protein [Paramicrobacterium sp. CJ85]|uniref:ABC transporter ATP-binding protein n=1 Tax=Paramicrobacterium sp. CJ85 TaxID=3445355 RepID=UPI003F62C3E5